MRPALKVGDGVDTNAADADGTTALHIASLHDAVDLVRLLLDAGADVGTSDNEGLTALHYASLEGSSNVASMLLDASVDPRARDMSGMTALHVACQRNFSELASLLLGRSTTAKDASDQEDCARISSKLEVDKKPHPRGRRSVYNSKVYFGLLGAQGLGLSLGHTVDGINAA